MNDLATNFRGGVQAAWANLVLFLPKLVLFAIILVVGYFVAKLVCKLLCGLLERVGFDRLVERGGLRRALERAHWSASGVLSKILFYFIMLFALQLAFGVFGPNPISDLLTRIVAYLPNVFVAALIVVIAGAIAGAVRQIADATLGGLSYGRVLAAAAAAAIWVVGIFAALDQLKIAPAIVNGLFYALLAIVAGSAIVAIGGGGIAPMRQKWEQVLGRVQQDAPRLRERAQQLPHETMRQGQQWERKAEQTTEQPGNKGFAE